MPREGQCFLFIFLPRGSRGCAYPPSACLPSDLTPFKEIPVSFMVGSFWVPSFFFKTPEGEWFVATVQGVLGAT